MHNYELTRINVGPIVCFSNYSILFGYNSPLAIIDFFTKNNYKFVSITDINMFSVHQYLNALDGVIPIYGISIYLKIEDISDVKGLIYLVFYCQQGYYNFLQIYNSRIGKAIVNKEEDIIFSINDFQYLKNNYGFYIIIGGVKSILSEIVNKHLEDNLLQEKINEFISTCKKVFKNNLVWMASNLNIEESQYLNLLLDRSEEIIYNYPIIHLDDFYHKNLEISPHIDMRAIHNHISVKDLVIKQNEYFRNEYFLVSNTEFISRASNLNLIGKTNQFISRLITYKFKMDESDYLNSYDNSFSREIILNYAYNNFINFITNKISKINCTYEKIKMGELYFKRLISEIYSYDKIQHLNIYQMLYIVCKFVNHCKSNKIFIGPGRGSCVGSLLVYMIKITSVDPIVHGLIFERFINLSRLSTPDIDIDVSKEQRHLLLKSISEIFKDKHGNKNIVHIISFSKFIFKMMIKDLIRISSSNIKFVELNNLLKIYDNHEILYKFLSEIRDMHIIFFNFIEYVIEKCTSNISNLNRSIIFSIMSIIIKKSNNIFLVRKHKLNEILDELENTNTISIFNNLYDKIIKLIALLDDAKKYSNCIKNTGIHAAGILIGGENFINKIPLYFGSNSEGNLVLCTHLDMDMLSKINVMKFDILGLDNLSIIDHFYQNINMFFDEEEIFDNFIIDNEVAKQVYSMISNGATKNIFQLEKMHVAKLCNKLKISTFEDIVALNSLNRPGTLDTINNYINNKKQQNNKNLCEIDKYYYDAANETYGVVIYQEQIMKLVKIIANYSDSEADVFRAIVSKKKKEILEQEKIKFIDRCNNNNISKEIANEIFYRVEKFAGYAFNKSHAVAYSKITAITAYLKFNHYIRFNLICITHKFNKVQQIIESLTEMIINANIWIKISNYKSESNIEYEYPKHVQVQEDFISIKTYNMIKIYIPPFLVKGVSVDDIEEIRFNKNNFNLVDLINKINLTKSKAKILNIFGFFEKTVDIDKLYNNIENKKTINKFNTIIYEKMTNSISILLDKYVLNINNIDATSIEFVGFSIIRANIIFILKNVINILNKYNKNTTLKRNIDYNIYFVYKIFNSDISIVRINNFILYKIIKHEDKVNIFDVILTSKNSSEILINFTQLIISRNSFDFFIEFINKYIDRKILDIIITYYDSTIIKQVSLKENLENIYTKLNNYFIHDIFIEQL